MGESEWADVLGVEELAMNAATTASTGEPLAKLNLGKLPHLPVDIVVDRKAASQPAAMDFSHMVQNLVTVIKKWLHSTQERMSAQTNKIVTILHLQLVIMCC